jgi:hypothetical protein
MPARSLQWQAGRSLSGPGRRTAGWLEQWNTGVIGELALNEKKERNGKMIFLISISCFDNVFLLTVEYLEEMFSLFLFFIGLKKIVCNILAL